jgi:hypothetical protein
MIALSGLLAAVAAISFLPACAVARQGSRSPSHATRHVRTRSSAIRAELRSTLTRAVGSEYNQLTGEVVAGYSSSGERHYANGLWENGDPSCWYCNVGPAVGAAYLAGSQPGMLGVAVASFNRAIAEQHLENGSFAGPSPPIVSAAFGTMLGLAYVRVEPDLDAATRSRWQATLAGIADFLISDRDTTWYTNGNINASYAAELYFAWRATGAQKYEEAYDAELQFMVAPVGHLWEGFGLVITQQPTRADGSDGRGFLTEGSPPGWDPEYSHLQLDFLSALYSASGDPRVLRLLNLILNQELTRVDPSTFSLNALGGTRKNEQMVFTSAALPLLVVDGKRPDLAPLLPAAFARLSAEYHATLNYSQHNYYRGVALWLAPILLATSGEPTLSVPIPRPDVNGITTSSPAAPTESPDGTATTPHPSTSITSEQIEVPKVSPKLLRASRIQLVPDLDIPQVEYAFTTPSTLSRGIHVSGTSASRLAVAAFTCTRDCSLAIRPLLVIHRRGGKTPVEVQTSLHGTSVALHQDQVYVSRMLIPLSARRAVSHGKAGFVRLRITLRIAGDVLQGRSYMFRLAL